MRFHTNQDARFTEAELFMHEVSAEINQLPDLLVEYLCQAARGATLDAALWL